MIFNYHIYKKLYYTSLLINTAENHIFQLYDE